MGPMRRPLALNLGTALDFFLLGKLFVVLIALGVRLAFERK